MKNLKALLEDISEELDLTAVVKLDEADFPPEKGTPPAPKPAPKGGEEDLDDEDDESTVGDHAPDGKGHYTADDLREIIDYVKDVLQKEDEESKDDVDPNADPDADDEDDDDGGDIGLDLWYEYADMLPETVINQVVDDLKDTFEIEDTMLEQIIAEGSSFFSRSQRGPAAKAARKAMRAFYRKNKAKLRKRNKLWRASEMGAKMAKLHQKAMGRGGWLGKITGKRIVAQV